MGKFSNKEVPSFLKKANYYSEDETFDNETGRNPQVTEECETCNQEPAIAENKVLRFADFLNEKKYQKKYDKDGDGDNDFEDYKAFKTAAINKNKKNESLDPSNGYEYGIGKDRLDMPNGRIMNTPGNAEYMADGMGHTCHDGSKNMLSEAAHHLIESMCESTCSDATMYENDENPEHKFEGYINEACTYMEKRMYEMVDDGMTVNEAWNNESACYESTCQAIDEVCEKLCHEALEIHNDESVVEFNDYVDEAIGCYRNGLAECAMGGYTSEGLMEKSELSAAEKVTTWLADSNNQNRAIKMTPEQQADEIGITIEEYEEVLKGIKKQL